MSHDWKIEVIHKDFYWDGSPCFWLASNNRDDRVSSGHSKEEAFNKLDAWLHNTYCLVEGCTDKKSLCPHNICEQCKKQIS